MTPSTMKGRDLYLAVCRLIGQPDELADSPWKLIKPMWGWLKKQNTSYAWGGSDEGYEAVAFVHRRIRIDVEGTTTHQCISRLLLSVAAVGAES